MTEILFSTFGPTFDWCPGSVGVPLPNTSIKIVAADETENGEELKPGETGEIVVKGPQVITTTKQTAVPTKPTTRRKTCHHHHHHNHHHHHYHNNNNNSNNNNNNYNNNEQVKLQEYATLPDCLQNTRLKDKGKVARHR